MTDMIDLCQQISVKETLFKLFANRETFIRHDKNHHDNNYDDRSHQDGGTIDRHFWMTISELLQF